MSQLTGVRILSIEAKDLYSTNHLKRENPIGYNIRVGDYEDNKWNKKQFINVLDYSLDLLKLREVYEKVYRNHRFTRKIGRYEYTQYVINVKFNYAYKLYNKVDANRYIRAGYQWKDIKNKIIDHVYMEDDVLIAIETNENVSEPRSPDELGKYFKYENGKYQQKGNIKTELTKSELREELYKNGFTCDGIKYVRWKRSAGSSRVGKCLFIAEPLYKKIHKWELCGLPVKDGTEIDLAGLEAYMALTLSSIIDTIELQPENFLIVDDYESVFKDTVVGVEYENGQLMAKEQEYEINNSIFDGESLLEESCFPEKYKKYSMLLLRQRMFKSACFKTRIQQWFADNGITDVSQLNGFTLATDISQIKIITTPSSIKYVKFQSIEEWMKILEPTFGIVKHEKPTAYFQGCKVSCHYQLINTLQLTEDDIHELLKPTFDYIRQVRNNPAVLRYHINYPYNDEIVPINGKNEIVFKLMGLNANFAKTKMYYDFRNDLIKSLIRELKQGHVLINGNYSTILGNGVEMLQQAIGTFKGESVIGVGNIHSKRFGYGQTILGSRSPHVCSGNVLLAANVESELIDRYFPLSNEVVYINSINENILQRLNGADFDSDTVLLTDNPLLIERAKKNYDKFKVPTNFIEAKKIKRYYTDEQKADLDIKTSVNKIGEDINLSQYLNSIMWDNINKGQTIEDNSEIYSDICKLAVLSNCEIDKAKRECAVDVGKEINTLKKEYQIIDKKKDKVIKPMFFKMITTENGYELNPKHRYIYFKTPMDYLQKEVASFKFHTSREKSEILPFSSIIQPPEDNHFVPFHYQQRDEIIERIEEYSTQIKTLFVGYDDKNKEDKEEIRTQVAEIKQESADFINSILINKKTIYLILRTLDDSKYSKYRNRIFTAIFGKPNELFYRMIKEGRPIGIIEECDDGNIELYEYKFRESERR